MKNVSDQIRPRRENAESKAETTRRVAREISQAEAEKRDAKTAKLRAARLARQAAEEPQAPRTGKVGTRQRRKPA